MGKLYAVDTNILLDHIEELNEYKVVLLSHTLREIEKHKSSRNPELSFRARQVSRYISANIDKFEFDAKNYDGTTLGYSNTYEDDNILAAVVENGYSLLTNDVLLNFKAKGFNIDTHSYESIKTNKQEDYKGYKELFINPKENFIDLLDTSNKYELNVNEYLIVKDIATKDESPENQKVIAAYKFDGNFYNEVSSKGFTTCAFGKFKPLDIYQSCALDSLEENKLTLIKGKAGSGKSMVALNYGFKKIEKGKKDKYICFVNPVASKNSAKLGYYPGTKDEKLLDSNVGAMLVSKFGSRTEVDRLIQDGVLYLLPFSDIRGFDSTGMNAIIHVIEAQNLDVSLMKLAIQRVGEDCEMIIDGDYNAQVDSVQYEGSNNGMRRVSEIFRGESYYGEVELPIIYRSAIAKKAEEM